MDDVVLKNRREILYLISKRNWIQYAGKKENLPGKMDVPRSGSKKPP